MKNLGLVKRHRSMMTHQDLMDFLQFLLEYLQPTCWNSTFLPRWLIGVEDRNAAQEKHTRWSAMRISLHDFPLMSSYKNLSTCGMTKQDINGSWNRMMRCKALAILIDRLDRSDKLDHINKNTCCIQLPDNLQVFLPHLNAPTTEVVWLSYSIHALIFHQGSGIQGHYRTSIRAHQQWWH